VSVVQILLILYRTFVLIYFLLFVSDLFDFTLQHRPGQGGVFSREEREGRERKATTQHPVIETQTLHVLLIIIIIIIIIIKSFIKQLNRPQLCTIG